MAAAEAAAAAKDEERTISPEYPDGPEPMDDDDASLPPIAPAVVDLAAQLEAGGTVGASGVALAPAMALPSMAPVDAGVLPQVREDARGTSKRTRISHT